MTYHIVLVGSNIAPEENVVAAVKLVREDPRISVMRVSSIYESPAVVASGEPDQTRPSYHNAALLVETELPEREFRNVLRDIEAQLGRERTEDKYADRTADLDIIATHVPGGSSSVTPDVREMAFAALPAAEVAPDWVVSPDGQTVGDLAAGFRTANTQIRRIS